MKSAMNKTPIQSDGRPSKLGSSIKILQRLMEQRICSIPLRPPWIPFCLFCKSPLATV